MNNASMTIEQRIDCLTLSSESKLFILVIFIFSKL